MNKVVGFNRRLTVTMSLLVIGTAFGLIAGGWFLLVAPSVTRVALSRIEHVGVVLKTELDRQFLQAERLLRNAEQWVLDEGIALDHMTLNHRFMPVLSQYPTLSLVLIAETSGKEWMLTNSGTDHVSWATQRVLPEVGRGPPIKRGLSLLFRIALFIPGRSNWMIIPCFLFTIHGTARVYVSVILPETASACRQLSADLRSTAWDSVAPRIRT